MEYVVSIVSVESVPVSVKYKYDRWERRQTVKEARFLLLVFDGLNLEDVEKEMEM